MCPSVWKNKICSLPWPHWCQRGLVDNKIRSYMCKPHMETAVVFFTDFFFRRAACQNSKWPPSIWLSQNAAHFYMASIVKATIAWETPFLKIMLLSPICYTFCFVHCANNLKGMICMPQSHTQSRNFGFRSRWLDDLCPIFKAEKKHTKKPYIFGRSYPQMLHLAMLKCFF